jgi:hypothetical protein
MSIVPKPLLSLRESCGIDYALSFSETDIFTLKQPLPSNAKFKSSEAMKKELKSFYRHQI